MLDILAIGHKIHVCRIKNNLSQNDLADKLFVTRQAISRWENGLAAPSIDNLVELIKIFNVSLENLLCLDDKEELSISNIFLNHDRHYVVKRAIDNDLGFPLYKVFNQFSKVERITILYSLKNKKEKIAKKLYMILSQDEKNIIGGYYEY